MHLNIGKFQGIHYTEFHSNFSKKSLLKNDTFKFVILNWCDVSSEIQKYEVRGGVG